MFFIEHNEGFTSNESMIDCIMNKPVPRVNQRVIQFSEAVADALERRNNELGIPVSRQITRAVEAFLKLPFDNKWRLLTTPKESRTSSNIPKEYWERLKEIKANSNLDLNELVQVAVALYLREEDKPASQSSDLELTSPEEKPRKLKHSTDKTETIDRNELRVTLREELARMGIETWAAVPAIMQAMVLLPLQMIVSCGEGDELDAIPIEDGTMIEVIGNLAKIATQRSFIAKANGWSMSSDNLPHDIKPGDLLLMTPIDEFKKPLLSGMVVLAKVSYKNGKTVETLKCYSGRKKLIANNPDFKGVDFGPNVEQAEVVAVCRGVLEKVFG